MRTLFVLILSLFILTPVQAARLQSGDLVSTDALLRWINIYRKHPVPADVPAAMLALSRFGAFNNPEQAGVYVGFLAGVLSENPRQAEQIITRASSMRREDHWIIVRALAHSGLTNWQELLGRFTSRMPNYKVLAERYTSGKMATLAQFTVPPHLTTFERFRKQLRLNRIFTEPAKPVTLQPNPEVLDQLWGFYFATGSYGPVMRIIAILPLSTDHNDLDQLVVGSMAKYTLASNAMHDPRLLAMLKASRQAHDQPKEVVAILDDVIDAAETVDSARIRKQVLATMDELRSKGPAFKRDVSWWGYVGQSVIAGGCIAAATAGAVVLGIPCVVGGAAATAATNFWNNSP